MPTEPEPPPSPEPDAATELTPAPRRYLTPEPGLPRGCNPLTFGVVMATLEMALLLWLWTRCS